MSFSIATPISSPRRGGSIRAAYPQCLTASARDTFLPSLDCLAPFGMLVNFGNASGPPPPLDVRMLSQKGSLVVTRVGMGHFIAQRAALVAAAAELFALIADGTLKVHIDRQYALKDAALAHRDLEERRTTGSLHSCSPDAAVKPSDRRSRFTQSRATHRRPILMLATVSRGNTRRSSQWNTGSSAA